MTLGRQLVLAIAAVSVAAALAAWLSGIVPPTCAPRADDTLAQIYCR